jgi:hypothetical protein
VFEGLRFAYGMGKPYCFQHNSPQTLVLKDIAMSSSIAYLSDPHSGPLFLEDVTGCAFRFREQDVWARQLHLASDGQHLENWGANVWLLGLKTRPGDMLVQTTLNGKTDILGGFSPPLK